MKTNEIASLFVCVGSSNLQKVISKDNRLYYGVETLRTSIDSCCLKENFTSVQDRYRSKGFLMAGKRK